MSTLIFSLPTIDEVGKLLSRITGQQVNASLTTPLDLRKPDKRVFGVFRNPDNGDTHICVFDWPLAVFTSAALLRFPKCAVDDAIRSGELNDGLDDALHEVMNVCSRIFSVNSRVVLEQLRTKAEDLPQAGTLVLKTPCSRLDAECAFPQLGSGRIAIFAGTKDLR